MKKINLTSMMMIITIGLIGMVLIIVPNVNAEPLDWEGYTGTYQINDILYDGDYMWLATFGGLVRYDKMTGEKEVFTTANSGLTSNFVNTVKKDSQGRLWIGTDMYVGDYAYTPGNYYSGLHILDTNGEWTFYNTDNSGLLSNIILDIAFDHEGNTWLATYFGGIVKVTPDWEWTVYTPDNSDFNSYNVMKLHVTDENVVWAACADYYVLDDDNNPMSVKGGAASYWDGVWTDYFDIIPHDYNSLSFSDVTSDHGGKLWFAGLYNGHYSYEEGGFINHDFPFTDDDFSGISNYSSTDHRNPYNNRQNQVFDRNELYNDYLKPAYREEESDIRMREQRTPSAVTSVAFDTVGNMWLGIGWGAGRFDGDNWYLYNSNSSVIGEYYIQGVYPDDDDRVFITSAFYGLFVYDNSDASISEIAIHDTENELPCMYIRDTKAAENTRAWISAGDSLLNGGTGGLASVLDGDWSNYSHPEIDTWNVNNVAVYDDDVYIATGNAYDTGGVVKYSNGEITLYNYATTGLMFVFASFVAVDSEGNIWAAMHDVGYGGVAKYDGEGWEYFQSANSGLISNEITALTIDPLTDDIWIGTPFGLQKFDGTNWDYFHPGNTPSLPGGEIWSLYFDDNNVLWIGNLLGLTSYDDGVWTNHSHRLPLLSDNYPTPVVSTTMDEYGQVWHGSLGGIILFRGDDTEVYNGSNSPLPSDWTFYVSSDRNGKMWVGTPVTGLYSFTYTGSTSVTDKIEAVTSGLQTRQNHPNPFNPSTRISFSISQREKVTINVHNVKGQIVSTLIDNMTMDAGDHSVVWNGVDGRGRVMSSGVYFYQIQTENETVTRRMLMLK